MQDLYAVLQTPTVENLRYHSIDMFDELIEKYPNEYENIISYINECFNYHSPFLIDEKDWEAFLMERFAENEISEEFRRDVIYYESKEVTAAIANFLGYQKQSLWTTYVAKQDLRVAMLAVMKSHSAATSEKKNANELVSTIDLELQDLLEKLKQEQKRFGNYKGYNDVKAAKARHTINIAHFIEIV